MKQVAIVGTGPVVTGYVMRTRGFLEVWDNTPKLRNDLKRYDHRPGRSPIPLEATPGRNSACFCGSGKKYKHCHDKN